MMKKKHIAAKCIAAALSVVITAGAVTYNSGEALSAASNFSGDSKVKGYEDQIKKADANIAALKNQIASSKQDLASAQADKEAYDKLVASYMEKISVTNDLIAELETSISEKTDEINGKQTDYEKKYELFKLRLRVTHEEGQASYLEMLLGAEDIADFLSRVDRVGSMLEYDNKIMNTLKDEKADLEEIRATLEIQKKEQETLKAQLAADEADMQKKSEEAQARIDQLKSDIATSQAYQAQNEKLREEFEAQLEARIKELEEEQKKKNSKYVGGTLQWPVPLDYTKVTSGFAWRTSPITGRKELHNGIDIPAPLGTSVYAANTGTVVIATWHYSYGNYIMIDHGGGIMTLYAHNSQLLVSVGDKVKKGQVIAKVSSTGDSKSNKNQFSVRKNGAFIDTMQYFK